MYSKKHEKKGLWKQKYSVKNHNQLQINQKEKNKSHEKEKNEKMKGKKI